MTWHLLIDYDHAESVPGGRDGRYLWPAVPDAAKAREICAKRLERAGYELVAWCFEQSTNGWHAKAELRPAPRSPMEIVALQAICGSDPLRESCNVQRAREVMGLVEYAATVLDSALAGLKLPNGIPGYPGSDALAYVTVVRKFLAGCMAGPGSFWLDRWNVLYAPNPQRKRRVVE